eukprot:COSAG05_NODE_20240_length_281_cov_0.714286_1_plen_36_part_10
MVSPVRIRIRNSEQMVAVPVSSQQLVDTNYFCFCIA